jgi:hypothetical protein
MQRLALLALVLAAFHSGGSPANAAVFRHNSLLRHYGPPCVYPAHFYDHYAPPTGYGHWGLRAYQAWGVGYNSYPYPYRAYYAGYGYGGYKTGESYPLFNNYGYAYPPQTLSARSGEAPESNYGQGPAADETAASDEELEQPERPTRPSARRK